MDISAKKKDGEKVTVQFDLPEGQALVDKYGLEAVTAKAHAGFVIDIQAVMRRAIEGGKTQEEIQAAVATWAPGVRGPVTQKSPFEKAKSALAGLTDEQKAELAALLRGKK